MWHVDLWHLANAAFLEWIRGSGNTSMANGIQNEMTRRLGPQVVVGSISRKTRLPFSFVTSHMSGPSGVLWNHMVGYGVGESPTLPQKIIKGSLGLLREPPLV